MRGSSDSGNIPQTAKERIERAFETIRYPIISVSGNSLEPLSHRENIQFGRYEGYAVLFKLRPSDRLRRLLNSPKFPGSHLLILSLTDGCLRFEATIEMEKSPKMGINLVNSILSDITISYRDEPLDQKTKERLKRMHTLSPN